MATKKKASAAQIAARKLFAARAKAGTLRKGAKRKTNPRKIVAKKSPRRVARKNPLMHTRISAPSKFCVYHRTATDSAGALIAEFKKKSDAVEYAKAYANAHRKPVMIVGKGL